MSAALTKGKTINPHLTLTSKQEELLFAALNSNNPASTLDSSLPLSNQSFSMAPTSLTESPLQAPGSATLNGFDESPFIDYDYEFDADGSFDYDFNNDSQGKMIGNLPGSSSDGDVETHDKRSHPDDGEEEEEGGGKRREGDGKTSKKPGRKPLTSEPTSKRKAQNRAAQRAFRERKEKHLKDLETKVEDLEKASESANHENSILRAQIEKMSMELREYRKRFSLSGTSNRNSSLNGGMPAYMTGKGLGGINNPNDVNFQFEFPKFGRLPGPPVTRNSASPTTQQVPSPTAQLSPRSSLQYSANSGSTAGLTATPAQIEGTDMSSLSGLFSPSLLESVGKSPPFEFFPNSNQNNGITANPSRSSTGSTNANNANNPSYYSSPSASSNSNGGPSSSCGTSPEPTIQSPVMYNKDPSMTTIGEESTNTEGELTFCDKLNMACGNSKNPVPRALSDPSPPATNLLTPSFDINGIDWFAQQNGNQFDPQLFGDYREPQENILAGEGFTDNFFADAFAAPDFNSPFNVAPSPAAHKKDIVAQIDASKEEDEVVPGEDTTQLLNCNTIWDRLQACPKVKEGEFDLDSLCKDLQKKARCSETGAVVNESDFNKIMKNYVEDQKAKNGATASSTKV